MTVFNWDNIFNQKNKPKILTYTLVISLLSLGFLFQNCSKKGSSDSSSNLEQTSQAEDELFSLLEESEMLQQKLASFDMNADKDSEMLQSTNKVISGLRAKTDQIMKMIKTDGIASNSNDVLKEVDMLLNLVSKARDIQVTYDSIRRDRLLDIKFSNLIQQIKDELGQFKMLVETRFSTIESTIKALDGRMVALKGAFESFVESSTAEDRVLKAALTILETTTDKRISDLRFQGQKLAEELQKQANTSQEAKDALLKVTELQSKLCANDANGKAILVNDCLTVDKIDCKTLIPNSAQFAEAVNQCQLLITIVKNHDSQLQALRTVDEKQNGLIDGIIQSVKTLNTQVLTATEALAEMSTVLKAFDAKISQIDERLMILEFKAKKTEAAASIRSRANFTLSWITRRTADINYYYCDVATNAALNKFDYEAGIQSWSFCKEKLSILNEAQMMTQVALTFANELESVNVDTKCTDTIATAGNAIAESIAMSDLTRDDIAKEIITKCVKGGPVYAKVLMLNSVKFLTKLGPDHRTYEYMGKLAPIASILFLGDIWEKSSGKTAAFENVDPTSSELKDTYYGRIERLFVNRYVENIFRINGKFPEDPNSIQVPANLGYVFTKKQITDATAIGAANGSNYLTRLKNLEVNCSDCGFIMANRNSPSYGPGHTRFAYPIDSRMDRCPVDDDLIVQHDSSFYGYHISYSHVVENFQPVLVAGNHLVVADNIQNVQSGNFTLSKDRIIVPRAGFEPAQIPTRYVLRATKPYGNAYARPSCAKFTLVPMLRKDEWLKPTSLADAEGLSQFLTGFSPTFFDKACAAKDFPVEVFSSGKPGKRGIASYNEDRDPRNKITLLRESWSQPAADNASGKAQNLVTSDNTQLTKDYFVFKNADIAYTGRAVSFGLANPFFRLKTDKSSVSGTDFIRDTEFNSGYFVQECGFCKRDADLANLNPKCDPTFIKDN